jgi:hypothetical protein
VRRTLLVLLAALALAAPAAAVVYPARQWDGPLLARSATPNEKIAESVAARLTRFPVVVRCSSSHLKPGELGVTPFRGDSPAGYFLMAPETCATLAAFRADPGAFDPQACKDTACLKNAAQAAMSLETVTHEAYHVLGYKDEATAECYGMQSLWYSAVRLGASTRLGETLAAFYASRMYPTRRTSEHPEYWSAECRDGGKLDLRRQSHSWPS